VLKGNTHPLARREFDLGTAPATLPMERMLLVLKRSPEQETALRKLLDDQQDKNSPHYHKWLTPEQFGAQFGPSDADMQAITSWLQSHGFQVGTTKGRTLLEFSGSASQVQEAFHTSIHKYIVNGEQRWANANDPSIPAALAPAVAGIKTLHNFVKKPMVGIAEKYIPAKLVGKARPEFTSSNGTLHALTPDDYRTIYNSLPSPYSGLGVTIAVVGRSNLYNQGQDLWDFRSVFGTTNQFGIVVNGPDPGDIGGNEELEATLDATWSGAVAPNVNVQFVVSGSTNTTDGVDLSELYIIENNLGSISTESFGICEAAVTSGDAQSISLLAQQAAAQGITYIVSSGDTGAAGCDDLGETTAQFPVSANVLASTPFTVALGGTMFNEHGQDATYWGQNDSALGSALRYIPENVWNETCTTQCQQFQPPLAAGGGGESIYFSQPPWQALLKGTTTMRDIPDISLSSAGHDPYLVCLEGSCVPDSQGFISFVGVLGTSAAAPSFASIMSLVVEAQGGPQGNANYVLYPLALAQQTAKTACNASNTSTPPDGACVFNDVTSGNISVPGETGYPNGVYAAAAGYDLASGLGSVNIANLVTAWQNANFNATTTTLTLNGGTAAITVSHGDSVAVAGTVSSNTTAPSGDVSLMAATGSFGSQTGIARFAVGSGGAFSGMTGLLPGGTYTVSAHYAGDGSFAPSDATPIQVTVNQESSKTSVSAVDQSNNPITATNNTFPFGSVVFVRADVAPGTSGVGVPTGSVTFSDSFGSIPTSNPQLLPPVPVPNPSPLNSQGNTSIGDGIISFDAGNHTISASYPGDASFTSSSSSTPVSFTIQPGFAWISGPIDVSISSPGMSGSTTVGIVASSNFTTAISFSCTGLPAEATCSATSASSQGPTTVVNTNITIATMGPHTVKMQSDEHHYYYAVLLGGGLPLGMLFIAAPRRRRLTVGALMLLAVLMLLPACGGSSHRQDPGTPAGTYTVTVTATAGNLSSRGTFTLQLQ
jgi:subtilase family serine protease